MCCENKLCQIDILEEKLAKAIYQRDVLKWAIMYYRLNWVWRALGKGDRKRLKDAEKVLKELK